MLVVFGGSFNPPTIAHYQIAKHVNQQLACEQFFFLPVGNQYPKKGLVDSVHRIRMLNLVCQQLEATAVCQLETNCERVLTTFDTLKLLQKQYLNQEIAFVIGADNLKQLKTWTEFEKLVKAFKLIVFKRNDLDVEAMIQTEFANLQHQFIILESFGQMNVSSSLYRESLANEHLVLPEVSVYVKTHKLYGRY